ncbi:MAG: nicotinamide mononucleotide transporter [Rhodothermales bacterium]|nr:nicotinamide mononucleotide transporter [Rhodothermales bacterium]
MVDILLSLDWIEASGLVFGLACVILLIRQSILTWPLGIAYVLVSLYIFYESKLYADLILHVFFLWMNIYGWYYWINGNTEAEIELPVTRESPKVLSGLLLLSAVGVVLCGYLFTQFTDASLPYWDSTTTILSFTAMWLTARKKIESWHLWFVVDVLASGIYLFKELYFYAVLYGVYIGLAIAGYLSWRRSMATVSAAASQTNLAGV